MSYAPHARIFLRYVVGAVFTGAASKLAADPDVVNVTATAIAAIVGGLTEYWYRNARRTGGAT